ncbi:hypothetical protein LEMLEM_LOCUS7539 [Lemmus lemmus]
MLCPLLCDLKSLNSTSMDFFVCAGGCDTYFERTYWESKEVLSVHPGIRDVHYSRILLPSRIP